VPWIIGFPFRLERPAVVETRTANVDIWPTLLELIGIEGMQDVDGRSRVPEILAAARGEAPPERSEPPMIAHLDQTWGQRVDTTAPMVTVSEGSVRYVQTRNANGEAKEQLFDAALDAGELADHLADQPEVAARLRGVADAYLASDPAFGEAEGLEIDEIQLNQLRALGYAVP
jgi:arylsulfatase A-like enzyme